MSHRFRIRGGLAPARAASRAPRAAEALLDLAHLDRALGGLAAGAFAAGALAVGTLALAAVACGALACGELPSEAFACGTVPADPEPAWKDISAPIFKQLEGEQQRIDWPGGTAGVAVDPATGDVFLVVPGQGIWRSTDEGEAFARVDGGAIGGRCETAFSLQFDPAGRRLGCFQLDGPCGLTPDGGKTWTPLTGLGRNWDYAAVDWSSSEVKNLLAARHETGGEVYLSHDGGKSWQRLLADPEFERTGGLGIFDERTLLYTLRGKGIQRSVDAGRTWTRVSDAEPCGRVARVHKGVAHWLGREGLLVSRDQGETWARQGAPVEATIGPYMDPRDERRVAVAGAKGIFESMDGGETWRPVAPLPETFDLPKAGWYSNVAWDPVHNLYYASRMGKGAYRLERAGTEGEKDGARAQGGS